MEYTNQLDRLPVELHYYIADIIKNDRWYKIKKHLEDNFIRFDYKIEKNTTCFKTKKGKGIYDHELWIYNKKIDDMFIVADNYFKCNHNYFKTDNMFNLNITYL